MVKLRLKRMGRTHRPFYRVCAMDARSQRDGLSIEELGSYDPNHPDETQAVTLNEQRVRYWLSVGAQPTETVRSLLRRSGIDAKPGTPLPASAE